MAKINRAHRAKLQADAAEIRRNGQRAGWPVDTIAIEITRRLPEINALEAWRLAYGWSRPQVVEAVSDLFRRAGLAEPGLTAARLCRWEHDGVEPAPDYADALAALYRATPDRLGVRVPRMRGGDGYRQRHQHAEWGHNVADNGLTAIADSVELQRELEGPAGGPNTREQLDRAVEYYNREYAKYTPTALSEQIHRCRAMVTDMLNHDQTDLVRTHLRTIGGWLSAQLGDLAFMLSDYRGADIHLATGARIGDAVNNHRLTSWSLGAQSMIAWFRDDPVNALELAQSAKDHARTTLHHAQAVAWCELRPLATMGRRSETLAAAAAAQRSMDAAGAEEHGRIGFDRAELHQHAAEALLLVGDTSQAKQHAAQSIALKTAGSGGWAAATVILAQTHAAEHNPADATALATTVLDAVPPESLRETTRRRLDSLDRTLRAERNPSPTARDLHDRLHALPAHPRPSRTSPEPNGQ